MEKERIALFIDGANMFYVQKKLGLSSSEIQRLRSLIESARAFRIHIGGGSRNFVIGS